MSDNKRRLDVLPMSAALIAALLFTPQAFAQGAEWLDLEEIERNCQEWAEQDEIDASELEGYLEECRRFEVEAYGVSPDVVPVETSEPDSDT